MAVLKLDPPPETDDIRELRAYMTELYDVLCSVLYNIDEDNLSEEFLNNINGGG